MFQSWVQPLSLLCQLKSQFLIFLSLSEPKHFLWELLRKTMFYFSPNKLYNLKEKRKKCVAAPEGDTVQASLKRAGLFFLLFPLHPFLPGLRSTCPNATALLTDRWNKTAHVVFSLPIKKKKITGLFGPNRVKQDWLNWITVYKTLAYWLNNSNQDIFPL